MVWRRTAALATAVSVALFAAACADTSRDSEGGQAQPAPSSSSAAATDDGVWDLVVLSDSSGWRLADEWAELIRRDEGVEVRVTDFAVGMQSGASLLKHLQTEGDAQREAVRSAEVISVWASPAGIGWKSDLDDCVFDTDGTRPPTRISRRDLEPYAQLWRDILGEINFLRNGQPTALRVRDIYVPVTARWVAAGTAEACGKGFATSSGIVRDVARQAGGRFIPVYRAFNGPDGLRDLRKRGLLLDEEHLNHKGVALMAALHHEAGYAELREQ